MQVVVVAVLQTKDLSAEPVEQVVVGQVETMELLLTEQLILVGVVEEHMRAYLAQVVLV
jgi:hypothetical protein